jgi:hypothetical protein
MITFADVNEVTSTAATLGQLRGLAASSDAADLVHAGAEVATDPGLLWRPGDAPEAYEAMVAAAQARAEAAAATAAAAAAAASASGTPGAAATGTSPAPGTPVNKSLVPEPTYKKWWFWAIVGSGAVFLGTGGYFLFRSKRTTSVVSALRY